MMNTDNDRLIITVTILLVAGILILGTHLNLNGVRVRTSTFALSSIETEGFQYPIEVYGYVEYDGYKFAKRKKIVEFCDVKEEKKIMRQELKLIRKEMKNGCKSE